MSEYQRVVLVTGATAGIGYELVKLIAQKGHIVYLSARNEVAGKEACGGAQGRMGGRSFRCLWQPPEVGAFSEVP